MAHQCLRTADGGIYRLKDDGAINQAGQQLATALPAKFNETIREALGRDAARPAGFENIEALPQRFDVMAADVAQVKAYIAARTGI